MSAMLTALRDLVAHKGYANAALLTAVRQTPSAAADPEVWELLHHVLLANRFWLLALVGKPFLLEDESRPSASFDELVRRYASVQSLERAWLESATKADVAGTLEHALVPNGKCDVSQAFLQVCLHSHGHRAQCAKLLRRHGGIPPSTDFIVWIVERPEAQWPVSVEPGRADAGGP
jgi:hypothetical protein